MFLNIFTGKLREKRSMRRKYSSKYKYFKIVQYLSNCWLKIAEREMFIVLNVLKTPPNYGVWLLTSNSPAGV